METPRRTRRTRSKASTRCATCLANPHNRKYVTMWNTVTRRKIAGTAAPCPNELAEYLARHPHVQVYREQDGGPEVIKQRRRDRNREKERKKRELKRLGMEGSEKHDGTRTVKVEAVVGNSSMVNTQNAPTVDDRLDHDLNLAQKKKQETAVKEELREIPTTTSVETDKLKHVDNKTEEKAMESKEREVDDVHSEDVLRTGQKREGTKPPALLASLLENEEGKGPEETEPEPDTVDEQEREFGVEFPEHNRQSTQSNMASPVDLQTNAGPRKRKIPFYIPPDLSDMIFTQRVWAAEAYAEIEARKRKRRREAAMEEEDEEIREFRDLIRRIS